MRLLSAHKPYVVSGYHSYCLKPVEWQRKQTEAIERQKQEAARVLDEAKKGESGEVDTESLPPGSYRDLSHAQLPAGCCEACPCRGDTTDPRDPTQKKPDLSGTGTLCNELVRAERQAHEEARRAQVHRVLARSTASLKRRGSGENIHFLGDIGPLAPRQRRAHLRYGELQSWNELAGTGRPRIVAGFASAKLAR